MTDDQTVLVLIGLFLWAAWTHDHATVNLTQTCPDGSVIPLDQTCPVQTQDPYVPPDTPIDDPYIPWGPIIWEDPWNEIYLGN